MIHENFNFKEHGFVGHLAEPGSFMLKRQGQEFCLLPEMKMKHGLPNTR